MSSEGQHSNEANNTSRLTNTQLNGRNYLSWARSATLNLCSRDKLEFITGENKKPTATDPTQKTDAEKKQIKEWERTDIMVMTWLLASMEPTISDIFHYHNTSKEMWDGVKELYGKQNNHSHIYRLQQEIHEEKKGTRSNTEYVSTLTKKYNELQIYRPPTTDLIELQKRADEDRTYQYLSGLDQSFETLRSQLLFSSDFPTYAQVVNMVNMEESRRLNMGGPQAVTGERHETQAFLAKNQNPNPSSSSQNRKPSEKCPYCRREGHNRDRCWFLNPHLRPKWWKEKGDRGSERDEERRKGEAAEKEGEKRYFVHQARTQSVPRTQPTQTGFEPGKVGNGSNGSTSEDPMQHLLQEFNVWFSNKNNSSSCGPDNRKEDW